MKKDYRWNDFDRKIIGEKMKKMDCASYQLFRNNENQNSIYDLLVITSNNGQVNEWGSETWPIAPTNKGQNLMDALNNHYKFN